MSCEAKFLGGLGRAALLGVLVLFATACTGRPFPLSAQQGSTFLWPVAGDYLGLLPGYTSEVTQNFGETDRQRGEMIFVLCPPTSSSACMPSDMGGAGHRLVTKYVTRVAPDRASAAAIRGTVDMSPIGFGIADAQVIAAIEIPDVDPSDPAHVPTGTYRLYALGQADPNGAFDDAIRSPDTYSDAPFFEVLAGPGVPTPFDRIWGRINLGDSQISLNDLVPMPKLMIRMVPGSQGPGPAAGEIRISYPTTQVEIVSAYEDTHMGQGSVVRISHSNPCFDLVGSQAQLDCASLAGDFYDEVVLNFVDADQRTKWLALVFQLRDGAANPAAVADFTIEDQTLYQIDGSELTTVVAALSYIL